MIQLTVYVNDLSTVMSVFSRIIIHTSEAIDGTYTYLDFIPLQSGVSSYTYNHITGTPDTWYKCAYYNPTTLVQSTFSDPTKGTVLIFNIVSYPDEYTLSSSDQILVRKIRRLIGDNKGLGRMYSNGTTSCTNVLEDNRTVDLKEKGWPVYVKINNDEYTTLYNPIVQGYQYLTFSGTLSSGVVNDTIEIWYNTFKYSDREIYEAYGDTMMPAGVPASCVSQDHLILQASIDLLENITSEDMTVDGAAIRDDQSLYDPSPGLRERDKTINRLKKMLDALIDECIRNAIISHTGVLID